MLQCSTLLYTCSVEYTANACHVPALMQVIHGVLLEVGELVGLATALDPRVLEGLLGSETLLGIEH